MKVLRKLRFAIWRWWFLRYKLDRIVKRATEEMQRDYREYSDECQRRKTAAIPYREWCVFKANEQEPPMVTP